MKRIVIILSFLLLLYSSALIGQNAPVLTACRITDAVPGDPDVPVPLNVTGFIDIGQFTLTLKFDTVHVRYVSASMNPSLAGMSATYTPPSGNSLGKLVLAWTGSGNVSLGDGSSIADLTFQYINGTGILSWTYTFGAVCQFKRYIGNVLTSLSDSPKYHYYQNGGISDRSAPVTIAPVIANPVPGPIPLTISVTGFTNIGSITLNLEYDPAIISYQNSYTKNPAFTSNFVVGDNPGSGGKRIVTVQWFGEAVNLADGSALCTLNFNYPSAKCIPCVLTWIDTGPSCEYVDGTDDILIDMPQATYYLNGIVAEGLYPTWTGNSGSAWDNDGNWNECGIPGITKNAVIPDVSPNSFPVISVAAYCKSIRILSGATVTVSPSGSIIIGN